MFTDSKRAFPTLLLCARGDSPVLQSQSAIFKGAGYPVITAVDAREIEDRSQAGGFDIAVLNHTLTFPDRKQIAQKIKERDARKGVLILHASGTFGNPHADIAVDSRTGVAHILRAVERVEILRSMRAQHADEDKRPIVVVDPDRNYIFANDAACKLVGFDHAHFMELRIDDLVVGNSRVAEPLFQSFVADGSQTGTIKLRHRFGQILKVKYWAQVRDDGYMMARWEPMPDGDSAD